MRNAAIYTVMDRNKWHPFVSRHHGGSKRCLYSGNETEENYERIESWPITLVKLVWPQLNVEDMD